MVGRTRFLIVPLVLCFLAMSGLARADVWNLQSQYSTTQNPNGQWSYGWEPAYVGSSGYQPNGGFTLYNTIYNSVPVGGVGVSWHDSANDSAPQSEMLTSPYVSIPAGTVVLHPGPNGEFSVVQWTAPTAGTINVTGSFGAGDSGSMSYFVLSNGTVIYKSLNDPNTETFSFSEAVTAKSTVDFAVGYNTYNGYGWGTTPIDATITEVNAVPEPSILLLFGAGLAGVGVIRRKLRV